MNRIEVTWWRATRIWWSIFWRGTLFTLIVMIPLGILIGILCVALDFKEGIALLSRLTGIILGVPIGIWVIKIVMEKQFSDFQIQLVPSYESLLDDEQGTEREPDGNN